MKLFFKKEKKSVEELVEIFKRTKECLDCKYVHDHTCIVYAFVHGFKGMVQFKKVYLLFFIFSFIRNFKKFNTFHKFLFRYYKFFKNPMLYVFFFNFIGKLSFCFMKKWKFFRNIYFSIFFCFLSATSIFFESTKRSESLSVYIFGPALISAVNHFVDKNVKKEDRKKILFHFNVSLKRILFTLYHLVS